MKNIHRVALTIALSAWVMILTSCLFNRNESEEFVETPYNYNPFDFEKINGKIKVVTQEYIVSGEQYSRRVSYYNQYGFENRIEHYNSNESVPYWIEETTYDENNHPKRFFEIGESGDTSVHIYETDQMGRFKKIFMIDSSGAKWLWSSFRYQISGDSIFYVTEKFSESGELLIIEMSRTFRLQEYSQRTQLRPDGNEIGTHVFIRENPSILIDQYLVESEIRSVRTMHFNDEGYYDFTVILNSIQEIDTTYYFDYIYDSQGNWIERKISKNPNYQNLTDEQVEKFVRSIEYY